MKIKILLFLLVLLQSNLICQRIYGRFLKMPNQNISLEIFNGVDSKTVINTSTNDKGEFEFSHSGNSVEVGYLKVENAKSFLLLLNVEDVEITGNTLYEQESISLVKGEQNKLMQQFNKNNAQRLMAMEALQYLSGYYTNREVESNLPLANTCINDELNRLKNEEYFSFYTLPVDGFLYWYFKMQKLINTAIQEARNNTNNFAPIMEKLRNVNYSDERLYKSGLLKDLIESQFYLIENSALSIDEVFKQTEISIDSILENVSSNEMKYNDVVNFLFQLFENHSLNNASEYLALKTLNTSGCSIDDELVKKLQVYQYLKLGDIAPNIVISDKYFTSHREQIQVPKNLSDFNSEYTLVVFGASWCAKCEHEIPQLIDVYQQWKNKKFEILFISLDEDKLAFESFAREFPFLSICDLKKWETQAAVDFKITRTPTLLLLDKNRKIVLKPNSLAMLNDWLNNNLK
jgi:thiol-disulfide isomerase/thioredoxin